MKKLMIASLCLSSALLFSCGDSKPTTKTTPKKNPFAETEKTETKKKDVNDMTAKEQVNAVAEEVTGARAVSQYSKAKNKADDIKKLQLEQAKKMEELTK